MTVRLNATKAASHPGGELVDFKVNPAWFGFHRINEEYAMTTDTEKPVLIATITIDGQLFHLMIDGNHRHFKAHKLGIETIKARVFSVAETFDFLQVWNEAQLRRMKKSARELGLLPKKRKRA